MWVREKNRCLPNVGNDVAELKVGGGAIDGAGAVGAAAAVANGAAGEPNPNEVVTVGAEQKTNQSKQCKMTSSLSSTNKSIPALAVGAPNVGVAPNENPDVKPPPCGFISSSIYKWKWQFK